LLPPRTVGLRQDDEVAHEERARDIACEEFPDCFICTSAEVAPQFREFERFTTALLNAFVGPRLRDYVGRLARSLRGELSNYCGGCNYPIRKRHWSAIRTSFPAASGNAW
jgi:hypothetical protein